MGSLYLKSDWTFKCYLHFLEDELPALLEDIPLHNRWEMLLQQDGAPPHFRRQVTAFLNQHFQNHWIWRQVLVAWPPRSSDLTPLDYYLWRRVKSLIYAVKLSSVVELLNLILDNSAHINDKPCLMRSLSSLWLRATGSKIIREVISSSYFINISIRNFLIKFHLLFTEML